jgi:hypothetical protein
VFTSPWEQFLKALLAVLLVPGTVLRVFLWAVLRYSLVYHSQALFTSSFSGPLCVLLVP